MNWVEWFGYAASLLVALSLTMSSIVRLRWLNLAGAAMFSGYGFLISAMPVALLNGFIVLANVYHLFGIYRRDDRYHVVETRPSDPMIRYWLQENRGDLEQYFPGIDPDAQAGSLCFVVLRNNDPVGLLIGTQQESRFDVVVDYVFAPYRDFATGHFLYRESGFFSSRRVTLVRTHSRSPRHQAYLARMGFVRVAGADGDYEYRIKA